MTGCSQFLSQRTVWPSFLDRKKLLTLIRILSRFSRGKRGILLKKALWRDQKICVFVLLFRVCSLNFRRVEPSDKPQNL